MPLRITRCVATPTQIFVFFSESVDQGSATTTTNYAIQCPIDTRPLILPGNIQYDAIRQMAAIPLPTPPLTLGRLLTVRVFRITSAADPTGPSIADAQHPGDGLNDGITNVASATVNGGDDLTDPVEAVEDLAAYPVLTEEVGYPPSPIVSGGGTPATASAQSSLGGVVESTLRQLLGWKPKTDDAKGFVGALNASFQCTMVEGRNECTWTPRTYAVQTDLSGGITGAQASLYSRIKDAVDKSLPLLDGLYSLDEEAKPEDIEALKAVIRTQLMALVVELGVPGGPRVQRVNQFFGLLLGNTNGFWTNRQVVGQVQPTDPDLIDPNGTLGNLRVELGLSLITGQTLVNTVEDEQDVSNFRIVSDYVTSLAQSWLNNLQFFVLNPQVSGVQPFFGTLLVLLSRQLSVIAEKVNEVRFTLDSVFIGPSERQTLRIDFPNNQFPSMFLEDLLSWIENFATQEGPQLIQEGGKYAVGASFGTIAGTLLGMVQGAENSPSVLPDGFFTPRVQRSLQDLFDQLQQLVNQASRTSYLISPEPQVHLPADLRRAVPIPPAPAAIGPRPWPARRRRRRQP
jgi:hypothetical protein